MRRVEKLAGQNESNGGGWASLYFLQCLTWRVKSSYSNPRLMTSPHRRTQKRTTMKTSIRQICGWMERGRIRIKTNLHLHFSDLLCTASWRKLYNKNLWCKKWYHFFKNTASQPNQATGSLQMMCYGDDCGGTGVAIVNIMEAVMERQGWQKWWWCGSFETGFIIFAPVQWAA